MPSLPKRGSFSKSLEQSERDRNYAIFKGNPIVQDTRYSMNLTEQKILARLISMIKPDQKSLKLKFSTRKYMKLLGLKSSTTIFHEIMYSLKHIADDSFYIERKDGSYDLWRWISHVHADPKGKGKGDFVVTFPKALKPYLFDPRVRYKTIYKFNDIMMMRSRYSPRLFELFRSYLSKQKVQKRGLDYSINELKDHLDLLHHNKRAKDEIQRDKHGHIKYKYPSYYEFKRNVLKPSCREINEFTEYNVRMKPVHKRHSKKTVKINVVMLHKNKKQMEQRNVRLYCMINHLPKSEWKDWRNDLESGTFYTVNSRKGSKKTSKNSHKSKTVVEGKYKVVKPSQNTSTKHKNNLLTGKKHPFAKLEKIHDEYQYYNPLLQRLCWSTESKRKAYERLYWKMIKIMKYRD